MYVILIYFSLPSQERSETVCNNLSSLLTQGANTANSNNALGLLELYSTKLSLCIPKNEHIMKPQPYTVE